MMSVSEAGMELMTATYDTANLRSSLKEGATERLILKDGQEELAEYDAANVNTKLARYDHDPSRVDALLSQTVNGTKVYFVTDALGSVYAAVQEDGTVAHKASYDAYGTRTETGATSTPWGYTGRRHDSSTSLTYYRARYMDSSTGTFLSVDPQHRRMVSAHAYGYVRQSPTGFIDPSGQIQVASGAFEWKYPFQGKDKVVTFGEPPDDHLDFLYPAIRLAEAAVMMPRCKNAFGQACGTRFQGIPNVAMYLADRATVYYAGPDNVDYQAGGAEGLGTTSNATPLGGSQGGIPIAYTVEATLKRARAGADSFFVANEYMAKLLVHELAHYAGVLDKGSRGSAIIDLSNPRTNELVVQDVVKQCFTFVP